MIGLFVFGTLLDRKVRGRVLGHPLGPDGAVPARLRGFKRVFAARRRYPVLIRQPTASVPGLLLPKLGARDRARLRSYEGSEYRLKRIRVDVKGKGKGLRIVPARAFFARTLRSTGKRWPVRP